MNKAQPIIRVHVAQTPCSVLIDLGCSSTIVNTKLCHTWSKRHVRIMTINGKRQVCCGDCQRGFILTLGHLLKSLLVMRKKILGFDLLLGYDTIEALGSVLITQAGTVQFLEASVCAALCIDWPDLRVEFNRH